jgi:hypothetical protein
MKKILGKKVGIVTWCFWWLRDKCDQIGWRLHRGHRALEKGAQFPLYYFPITCQDVLHFLRKRPAFLFLHRGIR